ncbi:MAG: hypothetical protein U0800_14020 [Isosphaeraceae bacterium]
MFIDPILPCLPGRVQDRDDQRDVDEGSIPANRSIQLKRGDDAVIVGAVGAGAELGRFAVPPVSIRARAVMSGVSCGSPGGRSAAGPGCAGGPFRAVS